MNYQEIKPKFDIKLDRGDIYKAICSAHADKEESLSIKYDRKNNKILIYCHAGCRTENIVNEVGSELKDLFDDSSNFKSKKEKFKGKEVVAEYTYQGLNENVLF